jgi:hypothetical protein
VFIYQGNAAKAFYEAAPARLPQHGERIRVVTKQQVVSELRCRLKFSVVFADNAFMVSVQDVARLMRCRRPPLKSLQFITYQVIFDHAVRHLLEQGRAELLPRGGGAYHGNCGGCPVGNFIKPRDYITAMEGIPVRYLNRPTQEIPASMDVGVTALKKALLRSKINVYDPVTIDLLSCLQNVHDVFGIWEWRERLQSIARQFGLNSDLVRSAA